MTVNGLKLPASFLTAVQGGPLSADVGGWYLLAERDAFGRELESELAEVYRTARAIQRETASLADDFAADDADDEPPDEPPPPGAIPDIADFSRILCVGMSGDGAPFCLDYRESPAEPQVLWWADDHWRVVAPDFARFLALFDLSSE